MGGMWAGWQSVVGWFTHNCLNKLPQWGRLMNKCQHILRSLSVHPHPSLVQHFYKWFGKEEGEDDDQICAIIKLEMMASIWNNRIRIRRACCAAQPASSVSGVTCPDRGGRAHHARAAFPHGDALLGQHIWGDFKIEQIQGRVTRIMWPETRWLRGEMQHAQGR